MHGRAARLKSSGGGGGKIVSLPRLFFCNRPSWNWRSPYFQIFHSGILGIPDVTCYHKVTATVFWGSRFWHWICRNTVPNYHELWSPCFLQVVGFRFLASRRLKKPRRREMNARGSALHSVRPRLPFHSTFILVPTPHGKHTALMFFYRSQTP